MSRRRRSDRKPLSRRPTAVSLPVVRIRPIVRIVNPVRPVVRPPVNLDRRTFHPMGRLRPAPAVYRPARRLVPARPKSRALSFSALSNQVGFAIPRRVEICVRRKERREVILAKRLGRKGARSRKTRNIWSDVKC